MMRGFGHGYGYGLGYHRGEMIVMMILVIIIIALVAYIVTRHRGFKHMAWNSNANSSKAIDILNEKLALGEITEEEYTKRKQLITGK